MNGRLDSAVRRWLGHERAGRERRGERALRRVFARLPRPLPSAGFAERVLARTGLVVGRARDLVGFEARALVAVAFALTALSALIAPSVLAALAAVFRPHALLELGADLVVGVSRSLAAGVVLWETLARVGRVISEVVTTPGALATLALAALVSLVAFRMLQELMLPERSAQDAR